MTDFVRTSAIQNAIRQLTHPFPDIDAFDAVIQSVILNNPFGCVSYMNAGANHPPVAKIKECYTARFVYLDGSRKQRGLTSESYDSLAGYKAGIAVVPSHTANIAAHGGTIERNGDADTFAASLKCHHPNGEMYYVNFSRRQVTVTSFCDDAILSAIEMWADGVPAMR